MLALLSPAKKMKEAPGQKFALGTPYFTDKAKILIEILSEYSPADFASLMGVSDAIAALNVERYYHLAQPNFDTFHAAGLLFDGDVYRHLDASTFTSQQMHYSTKHLKILSGLYGLLDICDGIAPYRLEMGTRIKVAQASSLYDYWQIPITQYINALLEKHSNPYLINLASSEYIKAIDKKKLLFPIIDIVFKEWHKGTLKTIGVNAKRARGAFARNIVINAIDSIDGLKAISVNGYQFDDSSSNDHTLVYIKL